MSWWTTEDSFVTGLRQGDPASLRGTPWWALRRLFDPERGDRDILVLSVPRGDSVSFPHTHKVELCDGAQSPAALIRLVREAVKRDARSLWRDSKTEARFWTVWYRLMTGMPPADAVPCNNGIAILQKLVAGASAYGDELLRLCDITLSEQNREAIERLDRALSRGEKNDIKTYGYICLKLWERYEDRFSKWLRCQFVLKALRRACDPNHALVLRSYARFRAPSGRLADLVARLNATGLPAIIKMHHDKAFSVPNPLQSTALSPSPASGENAAREIWFHELHAAPSLSTLYKGVEVKRDGTYQFVAVKVMSEDIPKSDQLSQLRAWFRDDYLRKLLSERDDGLQMAFPNFGVYDMRPNPLVTVSPWARHGNINRYVQERVKEMGDRRVNEIILDLMEQLIPAVMELHKANTVHGNLKGNNILITDNAVLQLADFGSYGHGTDGSSMRWHARMLDKSRVFMSPELRVSGVPTASSDMWAVSCVFLELYLAALMPKGYFLQEKDLKSRHPRIPLDIWNLILANWAPEPNRRLSAATMHRRLNQLRDEMEAVSSN